MTSIRRMPLHQTIDVGYNVVHIDRASCFVCLQNVEICYVNRTCGRDETFLDYQVELQDQISPFFVTEDFVIAGQLC